MSDFEMTPFEAQLQRRLGRYSDVPVRPIDAVGIARSARLTSEQRRVRLSLHMPALSPSFTVLVLSLLLALVLVILAIAGARLINLPGARAGQLMVWLPSDSGGRIVVAAADGSASRQLDLPDVRHCPRLLPDGDRVVYWTQHGQMMLARVSEPGPGRLIGTDEPAVETSVWSTDGWRVANGLHDVVAIDFKPSVPVTTSLGVRSVAGAWAPDGTFTAAVPDGDDVVITRLAVADGARQEITRFKWNTGENGYPWFYWAADGTRLVYNDDPIASSAVLLDVRTGATVRIDTDDWSLPGQDSWSPDGGMIALTAIGTVNVYSRDGTKLVSVPGGTGDIAWSPDSKYVAATDGTHVFIARADGSEPIRSVLPAGGVVDILWSPVENVLGVRSGTTGSAGAATTISMYGPDGEPKTGLAGIDSRGVPSEFWRCTQWITDAQNDPK